MVDLNPKITWQVTCHFCFWCWKINETLQLSFQRNVILNLFYLWWSFNGQCYLDKELKATSSKGAAVCRDLAIRNRIMTVNLSIVLNSQRVRGELPHPLPLPMSTNAKRLSFFLYVLTCTTNIPAYPGIHPGRQHAFLRNKSIAYVENKYWTDRCHSEFARASYYSCP